MYCIKGRMPPKRHAAWEAQSSISPFARIFLAAKKLGLGGGRLIARVGLMYLRNARQHVSICLMLPPAYEAILRP